MLLAAYFSVFSRDLQEHNINRLEDSEDPDDPIGTVFIFRLYLSQDISELH
jgi:hypothetical protein